MLLLRNSIPAIRRQDIETDCEVLWVEVTTRRRHVFLGGFYRPPNSGLSTLHHLHNSMMAIPSSSIVVVSGDFNFPNTTWIEGQPSGYSVEASTLAKKPAAGSRPVTAGM